MTSLSMRPASRLTRVESRVTVPKKHRTAGTGSVGRLCPLRVGHRPSWCLRPHQWVSGDRTPGLVASASSCRQTMSGLMRAVDVLVGSSRAQASARPLYRVAAPLMSKRSMVTIPSTRGESASNVAAPEGFRSPSRVQSSPPRKQWPLCDNVPYPRNDLFAVARRCPETRITELARISLNEEHDVRWPTLEGVQQSALTGMR